jgi:hypothetical protein
MGFISKSSANAKRAYTIAEDRVIVTSLEAEMPVTEIVSVLAEQGFDRTLLSVRYRINVLREASKRFSTLEEFYAAKR